jgi:hypothetical protein
VKYSLKIKPATNHFGGGPIIATILFNGKHLATIGCGTEQEAQEIFHRFLKNR